MPPASRKTRPLQPFLTPLREALALPGRDELPRGWFSSQTPGRVILEDLRSLRGRAYSHDCAMLGPGATVLDIGARSGAFSLYHAAIRPDLKVFSVEENPNLWAGLVETVRRSGLDNIVCCQSFDEAVSALRAHLADGRGTIELVRMHRSAFDPARLRRLGEGWRIGFLCGDLDDNVARPVDIYRLSAEIADAFFWRGRTEEHIVSGRGGNGIEVSIVVPIYNVEKFLPACVESLLAQTLKRKEIILVDDGSTDGSGRLADDYAARHEEVVVIRQENAGCAAARSTGLRAARGRYVGFVDSDDWVDPGMLEHLFSVAVAAGAEIAQCGFRRCYEDEGVVEHVTEEVGYSDAGLGLVEDPRKLLVLQPTIWRRLYRKDFLERFDIDFPRHIRRFDDLVFQFVALMHVDRLVAVPEAYYNYRLGRVGQDVGARDEKLFVHFDLFALVRERLRRHPHVRLEKLMKKVEINTHLWALSRIEPQIKRRYARAAACDIFNERLMIGYWTILKIAKRMSTRRFLLALAAAAVAAVQPRRAPKESSVPVPERS